MIDKKQTAAVLSQKKREKENKESQRETKFGT